MTAEVSDDTVSEHTEAMRRFVIDHPLPEEGTEITVEVVNGLIADNYLARLNAEQAKTEADNARATAEIAALEFQRTDQVLHFAIAMAAQKGTELR